MAAVSCTLCLEVFTDPVTTPCGHNFCRVCINKHWNSSHRYNCPVCKQDFLADMVTQLRLKPQDEETVIHRFQSSAPGEVSCDLCPKPRLTALKSCLVCLASYCQIHLQPHLTNPRLKRHQLIQPLLNLEEHICAEHDRPLKLFCREHSHFMCMQCKAEDHKDHQTVPLKEEGEEHQATLKNQIKERRQKIEEIRRLVELSQRNADTEIQEGLRVYNTLMEYVQQSLDKFKQDTVEKHKKNEEEAAQLIEQIQTEISVLEQRGAEMEQLWSSGDHLHFVQTFTSVKPAPQLNDWTEETVRVPSYKGRAGQAVSELKKTLNTEIEKFFKAELEKVQEFAVEVSLDPDTAHPNLVLSKNLKQVHDSDQRQTLPYNPERFSIFLCVLGKQKFSSGKFYFEVQVKGKTGWELGVAQESVDRKEEEGVEEDEDEEDEDEEDEDEEDEDEEDEDEEEDVEDEEEDNQTVQKGYWTLCMDDDEYKTSDDPPVVFPVSSSPEKVGVFVDYDEGLVSFYDVDEESLIYSFTENILPLLNPCGNEGGKNSAPLILSLFNSSAE